MLLAATNDYAALQLDQASTRIILGTHHWWTADSTNYILTCEPPDFDAASSYLTTNGAVVAPHLEDPVTQVGTSFAALIPLTIGVLATDLAWTAAHKISTGTKSLAQFTTR